MPDLYDIVASATDVEVEGIADSAEVQRISAKAKPSDIVFTINFPKIIYDAESVRVILSDWSQWFNATNAHPNVAGVYTAQTVNAAGQLHDIAVVIVSSDSGRSTEEVSGGYEIVDDQHRDATIGPTAAKLNAIEAG